MLASGVVNLADQIAAGLHVRRHYIDADGRYDPHFLVFEFVRNIVLREGQVDVVHGFMRALRPQNLAKVERGEAGGDVQLLAQQILMGQGKTAVITPLLCLVLADGEQLPIILLPEPLLDAARNIVRSSFVTVVKKRVYTLQCSRAASADQRFLNMMENALRTKGVMITTPTSTKSILLKFLENLFALSSDASLTASRRGRRGGGGGPVPMDVRQRKALETQTFGWADMLAYLPVSPRVSPYLPVSPRISLISPHLPHLPIPPHTSPYLRWADMLGRFQRSILILDELDWVCHPIKSELHFPVGESLPISPHLSPSLPISPHLSPHLRCATR